MVKFLLQRPIAVLMAFTACFIIGLVTYFSLPVSLLPDIAIPEITVQVNGENRSARELENTVVTPIRRQLLQVSGLQNIKSETYDETGLLHLSFDFGVNIDLAFIEVNEKIDAVMNNLPKETARPKVIKASATDIPVFYLNLTLKSDKPYQPTQQKEFLEMCELAENVLKRRIEQLPEVAMADITGIPGRMMQIIPDKSKLMMSGITCEDIEAALTSNNVDPGNMLVRDGYYEYNIHIVNILRTLEDVKNIYIKKGTRLFQLKDICKVDIVPQKEMGRSLSKGKRAVTLAIIKQSDENMDALKDQLKSTTDHFVEMFPDIEFSISQNQTELLDYTISNLQQNLSLGFFLIFIIALLFLGDVRSPLIIGINMLVSVVITFFLFYLFNVSLNIISLSGLILAIGMMTDSSIIVTENITQYRDRGYSLQRACAVGTTDMITPMLSSSLTTISVFVPLIFMSGIAGALFMDQAFSITAGLMVSYITSIMLLPILYFLFYKSEVKSKNIVVKHVNHLFKSGWLEKWYDLGFNWTFSHKWFTIPVIISTLPLCAFFFYFMEKERMPKIDHNELMLRIEWNENIHIDENNKRINRLTQFVSGKVIQHTAYIGLQDYMLNRESGLSSTEAEVYMKTKESSEILPLQKLLTEAIKKQYPHAVFTFSPPENIFEKIFVTADPDLVAELHLKNKLKNPSMGKLRDLENKITYHTQHSPKGIAFRHQISLVIDREKLLLYNVSYRNLVRTLRMAFKENKVSTLHSYQQYLPISMSGHEKSVHRILTETFVPTFSDADGVIHQISLAEFVKMKPSEDIKFITAGKNGEYIPLSFFTSDKIPELMKKIEEVVTTSKDWEVNFSGSFFSNQKMIGELMIILFVSLVLMYFILCAQFESFLQPLIVLLEIPVDTFFALFSLWIFGHSLNLMSAIGIIVTAGIVVNDSILKLDTINKYRQAGLPLLEAIHTTGRRRLRAIIMTSLTTILVMIPLLFTSDMGSELQRPLAIAMIGSMIMGTLVSLFIVPLVYWFIYRKEDKSISLKQETT